MKHRLRPGDALEPEAVSILAAQFQLMDAAQIHLHRFRIRAERNGAVQNNPMIGQQKEPDIGLFRAVLRMPLLVDADPRGEGLRRLIQAIDNAETGVAADAPGETPSADSNRSFAAEIPVDLRQAQPIGRPAVCSVGPRHGVQTDLPRAAQPEKQNEEKTEGGPHPLFFLHRIEHRFRLPENFRRAHKLVADGKFRNVNLNLLSPLCSAPEKLSGKQRHLRIEILFLILPD